MSGSRRLLLCWSRIISLLAAAAALALLQGCSAIKLAYNNSPELAYWWLDGYADLGDGQSAQLREELGRLQAWHRNTELPKIADLLRRTQPLATADATPEQACALFAEARVRFDAVVAQVEPAAVSLAMGLSDPQLAHIDAKFGKSNIEWREDWASGSLQERQRKRLKAAVERSEQFYGNLDEPQLSVLRNAIASSEFDPVASYAERLRRQQDLLQTLRQISTAGGGPRLGMAQATSVLHAYLERVASSPNPAYRNYFDRLVQENCKTFAQLHNSTTPEQRTRAARRLAAYERDARELAKPR